MHALRDHDLGELIFVSTCRQIQRVESTCVLLQSLFARLREMYERAARVAAGHAALDTPISPRKIPSSLLVQQDDSDEDSQDFSASESGGVSDFAPTLGVVDQAFFFAMVWGMGGGLTGDPALAFDVYSRDLIQVRPAHDRPFSKGFHFHFRVLCSTDEYVLSVNMCDIHTRIVRWMAAIHRHTCRLFHLHLSPEVSHTLWRPLPAHQTSGLRDHISLPATGTVFEFYPHFYPPGEGGARPYEWRSWAVDVPSFG